MSQNKIQMKKCYTIYEQAKPKKENEKNKGEVRLNVDS